MFDFNSGEQNQAKIQKMIEQEAIDQNYHMAMEEAPEVFARVSMLYIDTEVGHTVTRLVRPRGTYGRVGAHLWH